MTGLPPIDLLLGKRIMQLALQQALVAYEADEVPIGTVVAVGTRILVKSHNQVELLNNPTAHAGMLAITQATIAIGGRYLPQCTLYVTVEPCPMCMGALRWTQIGHVVYSAVNPRGGYMHYSSTLPHPKSVVMGGVCEEEYRELVVSYFQRGRRSY